MVAMTMTMIVTVALPFEYWRREYAAVSCLCHLKKRLCFCGWGGMIYQVFSGVETDRRAKGVCGRSLL
jgi:hypothetical protein